MAIEESPIPSLTTMRVVLDWTLTISWYIVYPIWIAIYYLAVVLLAILQFLYRPIAFILQPVVLLGRFIAACLALPFRLIAKLEVTIADS